MGEGRLHCAGAQPPPGELCARALHAPRAQSTWPGAAECAPDPGDPQPAAALAPRAPEVCTVSPHSRRLRHTPPAVLETRGFAPLHLAGKVPREAAPKSAGLFWHRSPEAVGDALHPAIYCPSRETTLGESKSGRPRGRRTITPLNEALAVPSAGRRSLSREPVARPRLPGESPWESARGDARGAWVKETPR